MSFVQAPEASNAVRNAATHERSGFLFPDASVRKGRVASWAWFHSAMAASEQGVPDRFSAGQSHARSQLCCRHHASNASQAGNS
ncbi:MAG TPA: hypothetical protein VFM48_06460, partial [Aquabacterium sp.]|nr:hypothetical protein [Aquabacterium sp.]